MGFFCIYSYFGAGVTNLNWDRRTAFNGNNPIVQTYWTGEHNKGGTNKKADYNWIRDDNEQDTDKAVRVLLFGGCATNGSMAGSGDFHSYWLRSDSNALVGFFTTVKLD